jgi:hypothetical protein
VCNYRCSNINWSGTGWWTGTSDYGKLAGYVMISCPTTTVTYAGPASAALWCADLKYNITHCDSPTLNEHGSPMCGVSRIESWIVMYGRPSGTSTWNYLKTGDPQVRGSSIDTECYSNGPKTYVRRSKPLAEKGKSKDYKLVLKGNVIINRCDSQIVLPTKNIIINRCGWTSSDVSLDGPCLQAM